MPVTATLVPDRPTIRLSSSLTLQATLQGPAPLRIEVPAQILAEESAPLWQVVPVGSAKLVDLPDGQQRWSQEYRASPFSPGSTVPLVFREFTVASGNDVTSKSVAFPTLTIRVETTIKTVKADEARPATGIEELPPLPTPPAVPPGVIGFGIAVAVLLSIGLFFALRRRKPVPDPLPRIEALRELELLVADGTAPNRLAEIVRTFVGQQYHVPAETMTTAELATAYPDGALREILEECDRVRFAGVPWLPDELQRAVEQARSWVSNSNEPGKTDARPTNHQHRFPPG